MSEVRTKAIPDTCGLHDELPATGKRLVSVADASPVDGIAALDAAARAQDEVPSLQHRGSVLITSEQAVARQLVSPLPAGRDV
jgi:hypothetical protein